MSGNTEVGIRLRLDGAQQVQAGVQGSAQSLDALDRKVAGFGKAAALTGHQTAQLSAQLQDLFIQIQSGGSPITALLQQGSQLSAVFGGTGNALRAVASLITPTVASFGAAAAAIGTVGIAYAAAEAQRSAFVRGLVLSGNAIGQTVGSLNDAAAAVGKLVGGQSAASAAMAQYAATGQAAGVSMATMAEAALRLERVGGAAVEETVKAFASLAKDPLAAALRLNDGVNFLTVSTYRQIKALQDQGNATEAARVAQEAFASESIARAKQVESHLGSMERGWLAVKDAIVGAKEALLAIGRQDTLAAQVAKLQEQIDSLTSEMGDERISADRFKALDAVRQGLIDTQSALQSDIRLANLSATAHAARAAALKDTVKADEAAAKAAKQHADELARLIAHGKDLLQFQALDSAGYSASFLKDMQALQAYAKAAELGADQLTKAIDALLAKQPFAVAAAKAEADAHKALTDALAREAAEREKNLDSLSRAADAQARATQSVQDELFALQYGQAALYERVTLRKEEEAALLEIDAARALLERGDAREYQAIRERASALQREVDLRRQIAGEKVDQAADDAARKAAQKAADEWDRTADSIRDGLTDAFRRAFESGEDFGTAMAKVIEREFKARIATALSGMLADGVLALGALAVESMSAGGSDSPSARAWISKAKDASTLYDWGTTAYNWYTGAGSVSATYGTSATIGGTVAQSSATKAALYGNAGYTGAAEGSAAAGGASSSGWGAAAGWAAVIAIAAGIAADQMEEWSLSFGGRSLASRAGVRNTTADQPGLQGFDPEYLAATAAEGTIIVDPQAITDALASALFDFGDKFAASVGATSAIEAAQVLLESDRANPSWGEVKFLGPGGREIGSTGMQTDLSWDPQIAAPQLATRGVGAFAQAMQESDAPDWVKRSLALIPAELERITPEISEKFADPLQQAQALNQAAAGMFDGISTAFAQLDRLDEQLAPLGGAFATLTGASSDARHALVELFGGMEQFQTATASYVDSFYTESERSELALAGIGKTLGEVGLAVPATREAFRGLVDAQDLTTESGRNAFASLMGVADAFAAVVPAARSAADILSERQRLEQDLLMLQGDTVELRRMERDSIDETNRALYDQIQALKDAQRVAQARDAALPSLLAPEQNTARQYGSIQLDLSKAGVDLDLSQIIGASKEDLLAFAASFESVATNGADAQIAVWNAAGSLAGLRDAADEAERGLQDTAERARDLFRTPEQRTDAAYLSAQSKLAGVGVDLDLSQIIGASKADLIEFAETFGALSTTSVGARTAVWEVAETLFGLKDAAETAAADMAAFRASVSAGLLSGASDATINAASADVGGLGSLQGLLDGLFAGFVPAAEQAAASAAHISATLAGVGVDVANTVEGLQSLGRDGFMGLVQAAVGSGDGSALGALLQVAGAFSALQEPLAAASNAAAERANLERQELQLLGKTAELRALERSAIDASNLALYDRVIALQDERDIASERAGLESRLLQLQGDTTALRELEREALDASNRAIFDRITALEDEAAAAALASQVDQQRIGLTRRLLELQGNTAELRRMEREGLHESNRALYDQIVALEDLAAASSGATTSLSQLSSQLDSALGGVRSAVTEQQNLIRESYAVLIEGARRLRTDVEDAMRGVEDAVDAERTRLQQLHDDQVKAIDDARTAVETAMANLRTSVSAVIDSLRAAYDAEVETLNRQRKAAEDAFQAVADRVAGERKALQAEGKAAELAYNASAKELQGVIDSAAEVASRLGRLNDALLDTIKDLTQLGVDPATQRAEAQAQIQAALNVARAGGELPDLDALSGALGVLRADSKDLFGSQVDYLRDLRKTTNALQSLQDITGTRAGAAEAALQVARDQKEALQIAHEEHMDRLAGLQEALDLQLEQAGEARDYAVEDITTALEGLAADLETAIGAQNAILEQAEAAYSAAMGKTTQSVADAVAGLSAAIAGWEASGGDDAVTAADDELSSALQDLDRLIGAARAQYETALGINDETLSVTGALGKLDAAIAALSAGTTEADLTGAMNAELKVFDGIYQTALDQYNALLGIDTSLSALDRALQGFAAAVLAYQTGGTTGGTGGTGGTTGGTPVVPPPAPSYVNPAQWSFYLNESDWKGRQNELAQELAIQPVIDALTGGRLADAASIIKEAHGWGADQDALFAQVSQRGGLDRDVVAQMLYSATGDWFFEGMPDWRVSPSYRGRSNTASVINLAGQFRMQAAELQSMYEAGGAGLRAHAERLGINQGELELILGLSRGTLDTLWKVPMFAAGGLHSGGLRLVGEQGPELEVTGPARYWSAGQTLDMLRNPDRREEVLVAEIRALRAEVEGLRAEARSSAISSDKTARQLDRWDNDGMPPERTP